MDWIADVSRWLSDDATKIANLATIVFAFFTIAALIDARYIRKRLRREQAIERKLEEVLSLKERDIRDIKSQLHTAKQYDPHEWVRNFENERKQGNEELAIACLHSGIQLVEDQLHDCYIELARYYVSIYPDQSSHIQLQQAERYAHIATLVKPGKTQSRTLLEQVVATLAGEKFRAGNFYSSNFRIAAPTSEDYLGAGVDAHALVTQLINCAETSRNNGHHFIAERMLYRARLIGRRSLGDLDKLVIKARTHWASELYNCGQHALALEELDEVLPVLESIFGVESELTLEMLGWRAFLIAEATQKHTYALKLLESLIPRQIQFLGGSHYATLNTRCAKARCLSSLGQHHEALAEIESVVAEWKKVDASDKHLECLARRQFVFCLLRLERWQEADDEIDSLLETHTRLWGADHPNTMFTAMLKADVFFGKGDFESAIREIDKGLVNYSLLMGKAHPHCLYLLLLRARCLAGSGCVKTGLEQVDEVVQLEAEVEGVAHPNTLTARFYRAYYLYELDRFEDALSELRLLLPLRERVSGPEHHDTLATRNLMSDVLKARSLRDE